MREIRKKNYNGDPEVYDLIIGTRNVQEIFSVPSIPSSFQHRKNVPVYTWRVNEVIRRGTYWMKHVRYPYLALEMILSGEMEFQTDEQRQIAGPGTLYVIPPGTTVKFRCHNGNEVRKLAVIMDGEILKGIMTSLHMYSCRMLHLAEPEVMEMKIRELKNIAAAATLENSAGSYRFLLELVSLTGEGNSDQTPFQRAVAIMDSNFQENCQIPDIACRAGVSESTLRRMFQTELHCSPLEYLHSVRLKTAAEKLRNTSLRIKEIALMCGFASSARFCTAFMKKYHVTPKNYRNGQK